MYSQDTHNKSLTNLKKSVALMVAQLFAGIDRNSKAARTLSWDMLETKTPYLARQQTL